MTAYSCQDTATTAHSHDHTESGGHMHEDHAEYLDTVVWTDELELFVEFSPLIVGHRTVFTTHLTRLQPYKAVTDGKVTVNLVKGQRGIRSTADHAVQAGIFQPALKPNEAGSYQLYFNLDIGGIHEKIDLGTIEVFPSHEAAEKAAHKRVDDSRDIEFTKEQAWKLPFAIADVEQDSMTEYLSLTGEWMTEPGTQRVINAPAAGNVLYSTVNLLEGKNVAKGAHLMTISNRDMNLESIQTEIQKAEAEFDLVKAEYERKKELHVLEVISDAEWQQVQRDFKLARSKYEQLIQNYSGDGIRVIAPVSGYVKKIYIGNGNYATAGSPLLKIGTSGSNLLRVYISPGELHRVNRSNIVKVLAEGRNGGSAEMYEGTILSMGRSVDKDQPFLPLIIEVKNKSDVIEGSMVKTELSIGPYREVISVPTSSLLENFGRYSVVVQKGGEQFEMRPVTIGIKSTEKVQVTSGLKIGEKVVSQGAYQVKMASLSASVPAHGHSH